MTKKMSLLKEGKETLIEKLTELVKILDSTPILLPMDRSLLLIGNLEKIKTNVNYQQKLHSLIWELSMILVTINGFKLDSLEHTIKTIDLISLATSELKNSFLKKKGKKTKCLIT